MVASCEPAPSLQRIVNRTTWPTEAVEVDAVTVTRSGAAGAVVCGVAVAGAVDAVVERSGRAVGATTVVGDEDGSVVGGAALVDGLPVSLIESAARPPPDCVATSATTPAARAAAATATRASSRR